mmetsp:Transcript_28076/g.75611  ORF Transcript_28076/g.75611 Transcript_28076/m.75611 type:complete len:204 (+) Transcript_28076:1323-1934(+)
MTWTAVRCASTRPHLAGSCSRLAAPPQAPGPAPTVATARLPRRDVRRARHYKFQQRSYLLLYSYYRRWIESAHRRVRVRARARPHPARKSNKRQTAAPWAPCARRHRVRHFIGEAVTHPLAALCACALCEHLIRDSTERRKMDDGRRRSRPTWPRPTTARLAAAAAGGEHTQAPVSAAALVCTSPSFSLRCAASSSASAMRAP